MTFDVLIFQYFDHWYNTKTFDLIWIDHEFILYYYPFSFETNFTNINPLN